MNRSLSYSVLVLEDPASEEEIKRAYRRLVKEWHPDMNPDDPDAEERFRKIQQAYDFLTRDRKDPDQNRENQRYSHIYSAIQDHPVQSIREMAVRYYAERGWFSDRHCMDHKK